MNYSNVVIAIDGPAASGKSTVAKRVADALGFLHVDTGSMYRTATWVLAKSGIELSSPKAVRDAIQKINFEYRFNKFGRGEAYADGVAAGEEVKSDEVNQSVSMVAQVPEVRKILVDNQRNLVQQGDLVMEGRDIGSTVFPETLYKFYLDANPEVRAQRRSKEGSSESIEKRDEMDSKRIESPLVVAEDADVIDTSYLSIDEVVIAVLEKLREKGVMPPMPDEGESGIIYRLGWKFFRYVAKNFYDYKVVGVENIPARGPMLLACNHVSFLDPPMVGIAFPGEIDYVARKTLFRLPFFNWLYHKHWRAIPIDQKAPELSTMREIISRLKEGNRLLVFPEGERSWDGTLGQAQAGIGFISDKSNAPILPIRIFGPEVAMPRGKLMLRPAEITLVVGKPFSYSEFEKEEMGKGKERYTIMANDIMEKISQLQLK